MASRGDRCAPLAGSRRLGPDLMMRTKPFLVGAKWDEAARVLTSRADRVEHQAQVDGATRTSPNTSFHLRTRSKVNAPCAPVSASQSGPVDRVS